MLTVRDLLKIKGFEIWAISPETSTIDALGIMAERNVGALLVLDQGRLCGIISERDFVRRIAGDRACLLNTPVEEYMTSPVITVRLEDTIEHCMKLMTDEHFRHLPVMEGGRLVGLLSIGDVVKGIITDQSSTIRSLEDYIVGGGYGH